MYNKRCLKYGEMAERSKAAVLKTVVVNSYLGFESLSLRQKGIVRTPSSCNFSFCGKVLELCFVLIEIIIAKSYNGVNEKGEWCDKNQI